MVSEEIIKNLEKIIASYNPDKNRYPVISRLSEVQALRVAVKILKGVKEDV